MNNVYVLIFISDTWLDHLHSNENISQDEMKMEDRMKSLRDLITSWVNDPEEDEEAMGEVEKVQIGREVMEWISVEDRLPKHHAILMIKDKNGEEKRAYYHSDQMNWLWFYGVKTSHFQGMNGTWLDDVTHWMPLPQPPKL